MKFDLNVIALMCATAFALAETENQSSSYYNPGTEVKGEIGIPSESIQQLYTYYYYNSYYHTVYTTYVADGGQTVAAIIFLDILLPILSCALIIFCIVRCRKIRRHHHGHHDVHHGHHGVHNSHHNEHLVTHTTQVHYAGPPQPPIYG